MKASSFAAVVGQDARVLILGSLPGAASLAAGQYYAHPRNAFWPIMAELAGASTTAPYDRRIEQLIAQRVALWDVCATALRAGSLDAAIRADSVSPNDIAGLLRRHADIGLICFNGTKAGDLFRRLVLSDLAPPIRDIRRLTLPSTSPAYAGMPFGKKLEAWRQALCGTLAGH